jgi:hypothetical protein
MFAAKYDVFNTRSCAELEAAVTEERIGVAMNGVTGRMGYHQHLGCGRRTWLRIGRQAPKQSDPGHRANRSVSLRTGNDGTIQGLRRILDSPTIA